MTLHCKRNASISAFSLYRPLVLQVTKIQLKYALAMGPGSSPYTNRMVMAASRSFLEQQIPKCIFLDRSCHWMTGLGQSFHQEQSCPARSGLYANHWGITGWERGWRRGSDEPHELCIFIKECGRLIFPWKESLDRMKTYTLHVCHIVLWNHYRLWPYRLTKTYSCFKSSYDQRLQIGLKKAI